MKKTVKLLHRHFSFLIIVAVFLTSMVIVMRPSTAAAHPPSEVTLAYDKVTKTLSVTITHTVSDPKSHYIKTVVLMFNGSVFQTATYDSQPTLDTFTYKYAVDAITGTELSARAECVYIGSNTATVTVP